MKDQSKIINEVIKTLKKNDNYVVEGKLNKTLIVDHAFKMDKGLLSLLLNSKQLKDFFFVDVDKTLVFDKILFQEVITNKQLLDDSFTKYKKEIGLDIEEPSPSFNNVVLNWPFKDCILEGGQTNDDEIRNEVFWNSILAKTEINNLLSPKALTNFNFYGDANKEDLKYDNQVIFGNNLIALHSIKKTFAGKIQAIYCDPPYNTGKDSFGYNDRFNHSTWLTFFKNRMDVCKDLLTPSGMVWVNLDDQEAHYAKVLLDEIYGRDNFLGNVIWRKKKTSANDAKFFSDNHDHILVYAKDRQRCKFNGLKRTKKQNDAYKNPDNDSRGPWTSSPCHAKTYSAKNDYVLVSPSGKKFHLPEGTSWRYKEDKFYELINDNQIWFGESGKNQPRFKRFLSNVKQSVTPVTIWNSEDDPTNQDASTELKKFHDLSTFKTAKPEELIKKIIEISTDEIDIILDPFAGSGTTAATALKMNRKFITCEQMDYGKEIITNRLQQVIDGEQGGISKSVNWKGGRGFCTYELRELNQEWIYKIKAISNIKDLKSSIKELIDYDYLSVFSDTNELLKKINDNSADNIEFAKEALIEIIDKSQLYLSYSEIEDKKHKISKEEIELNHLLYK